MVGSLRGKIGVPYHWKVESWWRKEHSQWREKPTDREIDFADKENAKERDSAVVKVAER